MKLNWKSNPITEEACPGICRQTPKGMFEILMTPDNIKKVQSKGEKRGRKSTSEKKSYAKLSHSSLKILCATKVGGFASTAPR